MMHWFKCLPLNLNPFIIRVWLKDPLLQKFMIDRLMSLPGRSAEEVAGG